MNKPAPIIVALVAVSISAFAQPPGGGSGDCIWRHNAYYGEFLTFDSCLGHQPQTGQYHYRVSPVCLREELNDNLVTMHTGRTGTTYTEQTTNLHHSPILGWALDGYPIYGPYGYSVATDATSPIRRIQSG